MSKKTLMIVAGALLVALSAPLYAAKYVPSDQEVADLTFMREEEKLARDVYAELYEYYKEGGVELIILAKIAASEDRHVEAMLDLLDKYRLDDPAEDLEPGEFDNTVLAALYENLVSDSDANQTILGEPATGGKVSPEAALTVGAWIEERDMIDILHAIANTSRADIVGVYTNLLCGSREHLRAFVKLLGEDDYQPQLLYSADAASDDVPAVETLEYWLGDASDAICM
jgi:hypothetical protein